MVTITDKAAEKIKEIAVSEGIDHLSIRVKVLSGGCSGFTHDMLYDNISSELDEVLCVNNIQIIIDPLSFQYLENINIDYIDSPFGGGFRFSSDDIQSTCACGKSAAY